MKVVLNIIKWFFLIIYILIVVCISVFILLGNEYGTSKFKNYSFVIINEKNENIHYEKGSLVIVKKVDIKTIKENDEVFVYQSDKTNNVFVNIKNVNEVFLEDSTPYITLKNEDGIYKDELIVGKKSKTINNIGKIIEILSKKWIFFIFIIVPCSLLAIYELYYVFRYLLYDDNKGTLEL